MDLLKSEKLLAIVGGLLAVVLGWVLTALVGSIQDIRNTNVSIVDRLAKLEERVEMFQTSEVRRQERELYSEGILEEGR